MAADLVEVRYSAHAGGHVPGDLEHVTVEQAVHLERAGQARRVGRPVPLRVRATPPTPVAPADPPPPATASRKAAARDAPAKKRAPRRKAR